MVKIAFVSCYPPQRGQLSEYAYTLLSKLEECSTIDTIDLITEKTGNNSTEKISNKTTAHRIWKQNSPLSLFNIPKKIISLKPAVVHFNVHMAVFGQSRIANFFGLLTPFICKMFGFKTIVTLHNMIENIDVEKVGYKNSLLNKTSAFLVTKLIANTSAVTLTMKSHTTLFKEKYHCKKAITIPHGTWVTKTNVRNNPTDCILYFGYSGPYKDIDLLFDSVKLLGERKRSIKLIFSGTSHPNYPNYLEKFLKPRENVVFTGYVPEEQLECLFEKANAVILPYLTCTGTSGVVHLASSFGTPIIATDLPEFRELANEGCGLLISKRCPQAFADRIEEILDNPNIAFELRKRNFEFAQSRSWDIVAASFCTLYEDLQKRVLTGN